MLSPVVLICARLSMPVGLGQVGRRQWAEGLPPLEGGQVVLGARCRTKTGTWNQSLFVIECHPGTARAERCDKRWGDGQDKGISVRV